MSANMANSVFARLEESKADISYLEAYKAVYSYSSERNAGKDSFKGWCGQFKNEKGESLGLNEDGLNPELEDFFQDLDENGITSDSHNNCDKFSDFATKKVNDAINICAARRSHETDGSPQWEKYQRINRILQGVLFLWSGMTESMPNSNPPITQKVELKSKEKPSPSVSSSSSSIFEGFFGLFANKPSTPVGAQGNALVRKSLSEHLKK